MSGESPPGVAWHVLECVCGARLARRVRSRWRYARLWACRNWFWPMGAWLGSVLSPGFCAILIGESAAILSGFVWLKLGQWSFWGSAALHVLLLLAGACCALQILSQLWPAWYGAAATKLMAFSSLLFVGWLGTTSARHTVAEVFNAPVEFFPAAAAASTFLTAQHFLSLPLLFFCLFLELLILPAAFVSYESVAVKRRRRWMPMLAIGLSFVALLGVSLSSGRLAAASTQAVLVGQIGWWGDLVEAPAHCKHGGGAQRIVLRTPERLETMLVRAAERFPSKPAWAFDIHERARFGAFDVTVVHCPVGLARHDNLSKVEKHQAETKKYWGVAPIATVEIAVPSVVEGSDSLSK